MRISRLRKRILKLILPAALCLLALASCARAGEGGAPSVSPQPGAGTEAPGQPTALPDLPVKVVSTYILTDADGNFHLAGEVYNGSSAAVEAVTLSASVLDAAGASLLRAESGEALPLEQFVPLVSRIENDASAPFDLPLPPGIPAPDQSLVTVVSYQSAQAVDVPLQAVNLQWMPSSDGRAVLVGELINSSAFPVRVDQLAALARDNAGNLAATAQGTIFPGILMAQGDANQQDRAPFKIPFNISVSAELMPDVFTNAVQIDPLDGAPLAIDQNIAAYLDADGNFHLVSSIKNPGDQPHGALILGGLYSDTGTVMDAAGLLLPVNLLPGEELPFDLSQFVLINQKPDYQAKLDHFTLQVDPAWLAGSAQVHVSLDGQNLQEQPGENGRWAFTGEAVNTSGQNLVRMVVFAVLKMPSGSVAATSFAVLENPAGVLEPGVSMAYSIDVMTNPALDAASLKSEVILIGVVESPSD